MERKYKSGNDIRLKLLAVSSYLTVGFVALVTSSFSAFLLLPTLVISEFQYSSQNIKSTIPEYRKDQFEYTISFEDSMFIHRT